MVEKEPVEYRTLIASDYNKCTNLISLVFDKSELPRFRKTWKEKELRFSSVQGLSSYKRAGWVYDKTFTQSASA